MKEETSEKKVKSYSEQIRKEISQWKDINQNGCNDPFWPDGCNLNLTRNHIISYKRAIAELCEKTGMTLPEEYFLKVPPEVDDNYMANLKQRDRVKQIFFGGHVPVQKKYLYDEMQICLF